MNPSASQPIDLLQELIAIPSFSKEESETATVIRDYLSENGIEAKRYLNNIWAKNKHFDTTKPTILLNSHHDTVQPSSTYSRDPFEAHITNDTLYGLGSNDAGGALSSLIATFIHFYEQKDLNYNLLLAITAEEEISGDNGIGSLLKEIPSIKFGIVVEPTQMQMAVA